MSQYFSRNSPKYSNRPIESIHADNPHIQSWWNEEHDSAISRLIGVYQWDWYLKITDSIVEITSGEVIEYWKQNDPNCGTWYNTLMHFAKARALSLGHVTQIRKPIRKTCPLCNEKFMEDSLPFPFAQRLGYDRLNFCSPCLTYALWDAKDDMSRIDIQSYLRKLTSALGRVPAQSFGKQMIDFQDLNDEQRLSILGILKNRPSDARIKELYGSWLNALIKARVLKTGTRKTSRGTQTIALDGHVCHSLAERTIDDLLFKSGVPHKREVRYPEGSYRADFSVNGIFIEYFGLTGDKQYDAKSEVKQTLCHKHGITLISIFPTDLLSMEKLIKKLEPIMPREITL